MDGVAVRSVLFADADAGADVRQHSIAQHSAAQHSTAQHFWLRYNATVSEEAVSG